MQLPGKYVISKSLKIGTVYKMVAPEMIDTEIPHFFIVVAQNDENNYLLLSTTQIIGKYNFYKGKQSMDTIANIEATTSNGFTKSSYIDCNQHYEITVSQLEQKVDDEKLHIAGQLSKEEFSKVLTSMSISTMLDIPKFIIPTEL